MQTVKHIIRIGFLIYDLPLRSINHDSDKERRMIVYISGPISSDKDYLKHFRKAERRLKSQGHDVINPAKIGHKLPKLNWMEYMHIDMAMLDCADAIYMLDGWRHSPGARMEYKIARDDGKYILHEGRKRWKKISR